MRSRNLKPGFFRNELLGECSFQARLLFAGLWCLADREGRFEWRPKRIRAEVFPYDALKIEPVLEELLERAFVRRYSLNGAVYGYIPKFHLHQKPHVRESESTCPAPDEAPPGHSQGDASAQPGPRQGGLNPSSLNPSSLNPSSLNGDNTQARLGEFSNVLLTAEEFEKLEQRFTKEGAAQRIEALSAYVKSTGRRYKSHYATLLTWENRKREGKRSTKGEREKQALREFCEEGHDT